MNKSCVIFGWRVLFNALLNQQLDWCCQYISASASVKEIQNSDSYSTVVIGKSPVLARKYGIRQSQKIFESEIKALVERCMPSRVVYISSVAVYGNALRAYVPFSEDSVALGSTPYAEEKILTEKNLHQLSVKLGFQLLILRPSGLFGLPVSEKRSNLIDRLKDARSQKTVLSLKIDDHGEQIRDFCEFQFLVDVIKFFMEQKKCSGVYNVASTGFCKIRELIEIFGQSQNVEYLPSKAKLIHNCVQTDKLMHELRASGASKRIIETLERRDDKLKLFSWD